MTGTRTLTDLIPGGSAVEFTITADTNSLNIESMVLDAQREQATLVHARLADARSHLFRYTWQTRPFSAGT